MSVRIEGRRWAWAPLALTLGFVGPFGCREPHDIVPVAPPGVSLERLPVGPQNEAQALGETGPASTTADKPSATVTTEVTAFSSTPPTEVGKPVKTASGLEYVTLKEGNGATAQVGQNVEMHYTGTLTDGKVFDSSRTKGRPFPVKIGAGEVIKGWDEGVPGMKVGEIRKLTIPPELGYGKRGAGSAIPPDATLIFEVELMKVN